MLGEIVHNQEGEALFVTSSNLASRSNYIGSPYLLCFYSTGGLLHCDWMCVP